MSCKEITELVTDYVEGRLSLGQRFRFQFHLGTCRHCRAFLRQMRTTIRLTGRLPDAARSTSQEGRARAGIEVGTASATQGGRTDNGTPPPRQGATDRPATPADKTDTANNSANRAARQGETEDKEFNRIPDQGATMMPRHQQKKEASAAKKRGKARKDRTTAGGKTVDAPNPEAADTPATKNRKQ